jgi:hypothetical protein
MTHPKILFYLVWKRGWQFETRPVVKETPKTFTYLYASFSGATSETRCDKPSLSQRFYLEQDANDFADCLNEIAGSFDVKIKQLQSQRTFAITTAFAEISTKKGTYT